MLLTLIATVGCDSSIPSMTGDQTASPEATTQAATLTPPRLTATESPSETPMPTATAEPSPTASPTVIEPPPFPVSAGEILYMDWDTFALRAIGVDGHNDRFLMQLSNSKLPAAISPDGRYVAMHGFGVPALLDLQSGEMFMVDTVEGSTNQFMWSADGQTLFFDSRDQTHQTLRRVMLPPNSPSEEVASLMPADFTITREFIGPVGDSFVLLRDADGSSERFVYTTFLCNWQTHEERVLMRGAYTPWALSQDGTRLLLARYEEINYVGAGTLEAFYTANLSITDGIQNIEHVVTDDTETLFGFDLAFAPDNRTIYASRFRDYAHSETYKSSTVILTPRGDGTYEQLDPAPPDGLYAVGGIRFNSSTTVLVYHQVKVGEHHDSTLWAMPMDG